MSFSSFLNTQYLRRGKEKQIHINKNICLSNYNNLPILYYHFCSKNKKKIDIQYKYTNHFSKHFTILNKYNIINKICIDNKIYFNKFNHNGIKLLYNSELSKKEKNKINKYNLYSII